MHDDMNGNFTPEVLKKMAEVYTSKMVTRIALFTVFAIGLILFLAITGCTTAPTVEKDHCGNPNKVILCKSPM